MKTTHKERRGRGFRSAVQDLLAGVVRARRGRAALARPKSAGFSLLEIMIVLAIIALITAGVGTVVFNSFKKAKIQIAKQRVGTVRDAVVKYMIDNASACPKGIDDLIAQKYIDKSFAKDPWDKPFLFLCPGTNDTDSADITSAGPDKQEGTADDIKSWD
jgi:general secretion pathway protein G